MSEIYDLSDRFVDRFAALDPVSATLEGLAGHDDEMTDFSPGGYEERNEHSRATLRALTAAAAGRRPRSHRRRRAARGAGDRDRALRHRRAPPRAERHRQPRASGSHVLRHDAHGDRVRLGSDRRPHGARARRPRVIPAEPRRGCAPGARGGPSSGRRVHAPGRDVEWSERRGAPVLPDARRPVRRGRARATRCCATRSSSGRPSPPRRTPRSAGSSPTSTRRTRRARRRRRGALRAARPRVQRHASSTSPRRTRGVGTSSTASSTPWARWPSASCPGSRSTP